MPQEREFQRWSSQRSLGTRNSKVSRGMTPGISWRLILGYSIRGQSAPNTLITVCGGMRTWLYAHITRLTCGKNSYRCWEIVALECCSGWWANANVLVLNVNVLTITSQPLSFLQAVCMVRLFENDVNMHELIYISLYFCCHWDIVSWQANNRRRRAISIRRRLEEWTDYSIARSARRGQEYQKSDRIKKSSKGRLAKGNLVIELFDAVVSLSQITGKCGLSRPHTKRSRKYESGWYHCIRPRFFLCWI